MGMDDDLVKDDVMSDYFGDDQVRAIINLKVDTMSVEDIAEELSVLDVVEDVYLVTGDTDIVLNLRFHDYPQLKRFLVGSLAGIEGVNDIRTLMVVSVFKERGSRSLETD